MRVGDRARVTVKDTVWLEHLKNVPATVFYIDEKNLYADHMKPIQVELDEPYDVHGQRMLRVTLKEVSPLE